MANTLEGALANVPFLGGWVAADQERRAQQEDQLRQAAQRMTLQKALEDRAQEQAFRSDLTQLGPNPNQESLAQLASKYAKPADLLRTQQASLDRQAALAAQREAVVGRLEQAKQQAEMTHEIRMAGLQSATDRQAETVRHNQAMEALNAQNQALNEQFKRMGLDIQKGMLETRRDAIANANKPPSGYRYTDEGNLQAIPGGPADTKLQGVFNQDTAALNESVANMDRLANVANQLKSHPGLAGITGIRGAIPNIPGTQAANAQALLDTLRSQVGFGVLQNMRNNSKSGGALGQVSNVEEKLLQDNLAALGKAQSKEQYEAELNKIIRYTEEAKDRLSKAYNMKHGDRPTAGRVVDFQSLRR